MSDNCPFHIDHETRIKNLETEVKEMKAAISNPAVMVGFISLIGVCITALTTLIGTILAPIAVPAIRAFLGV